MLIVAKLIIARARQEQQIITTHEPYNFMFLSPL